MLTAAQTNLPRLQHVVYIVAIQRRYNTYVGLESVHITLYSCSIAIAIERESINTLMFTIKKNHTP